MVPAKCFFFYTSLSRTMAGVSGDFSRLCTLKQEGRVGHSEELLKKKLLSKQEINYRKMRQKPPNGTYFSKYFQGSKLGKN